MALQVGMKVRKERGGVGGNYGDCQIWKCFRL